MFDENHLSFDLDDAAATALQRRWLSGPGATQAALRQVYLDTPGHDLRKAGLSLGLLPGDSGLQPLRPTTSGDAWRMDSVLQGQTQLPDAMLQAVLALDADQLAPVFRITTRRVGGQADGDMAQIGLMLDRSRVAARSRQGAYCQLHLTLLAGDSAALFATARRLDRIAALWPVMQTDAERGFALLAKVPTSHKAEPIALRPDMTAAEGFVQIAFSCLRQYSANQDLLRRAHLPEAVHQARVALRRLRSAFAISRNVIASPHRQRLADELRWLAGALGTVRDLDVLSARAAQGSPLQDRLHAARSTAYAQLRPLLEGPRTRALMLDLIEFLSIGDWLQADDTVTARMQPLHVFAATTLTRSLRKLRRDGQDVAGLTDADRHRVRKDAKKLRYGVDFFAALYAGGKTGHRHADFSKALARLQDQLGLLNDLAATPELLAQLGLADHPDAPGLLGKSGRKPLIRQATAAMDQLSDAAIFWS